SHDVRDAVAALVNVRISNHQQDPFGRALHQAASGFENCDTGAFRSHQRAGNMKTVFRQKLIQVVSGNAARDFGKPGANQISVVIAQEFQPGIDFAAPAAFANDSVGFRVAGLAYFHAQAVVGEDLQFFDVVVGLARHDGVHTAGVIAD